MEENNSQISITKKVMTPEHGNVPVENLVKVMPREDGTSMFDRKDLLVAQPGGNRFIDRISRLKNPSTLPDKRKEDQDAIKSMAQKAVDRKMVDVNAIRTELRRAMRNSDWVNIRGNLIKAARDLEAEAMLDPQYAASPAYQHLVEQEILGYAQQAGFLAELEDPNTDPGRVTEIRNVELRRLREVRGPDGFLNLGVRLYDELGKDLPPRGSTLPIPPVAPTTGVNALPNPNVLRSPEQTASILIEEIEKRDMPVVSRAGIAGAPSEDLHQRGEMTTLVEKLEDALEQMPDGEKKALIEARLRFHDAFWMVGVGLRSEGVNGPDYFDNAYGTPDRQKYAPQPKDFEVVFAGNLPTEQAKQKLKVAYTKGYKVKGVKRGNAVYDMTLQLQKITNEADKQKVFDTIIDEITPQNGQASSQEKDNAKLALELARRYAYFSGLQDLWYKNFPVRWIASMADLKGFRNAQDPFPKMTIEAIPALPVSAFPLDVKVPQYDARGKKLEGSDEYMIRPDITDLVERNEELNDIDLSMVDWNSLQAEDPLAYRNWIDKKVANGMRIRDLFGQDNYSTKDLVNSDFWNKAEGVFYKVVGAEDPLGLRAMWVAQIYGECADKIAPGTFLDVSLDDQIDKLEKILITPVREGRSFLTEEEKDWALGHGHIASKTNQRGKMPENKTIAPGRPLRQVVDGKLVIYDKKPNLLLRMIRR